ncbi:rhomboid family intramembrane serine protease [Moraxella sp. ZY210820]|uniref:rhomboid family intramembrane serine protease n=1 Tax=unclassified Moraxella TaxID=2685852 RepID=UPI00272F896B|nr:rhomboid family intramembrane serine protease [Moraxella sp. ZY210820]
MSAFAGSALHLFYADYQLSQSVAQLMQYGLSETQIYQQLAQGTIYAPEQSREIALSALGEYWQKTIGASGAVFGVLTAFARLYPHHQVEFLFIPKPIQAKYFVSFMVIYELFAQISGWSILGQNIAHLAHIGGAVVGFILADLCLRLRK